MMRVIRGASYINKFTVWIRVLARDLRAGEYGYLRLSARWRR